MYLFIIFSIIVIFCFAAIIYAGKNANNCDDANVTHKELKEILQTKKTPEYSQPTPNPSPSPSHNVPSCTPSHNVPSCAPSYTPRSPYLPYDPLYNLYSISPMSSLYTYLVEDHPHGFIERGPRGRSPRERGSRERGPIGGNVIQNFNTNFSGGHTGERL